ncbi:uncharacterized protein LOC142813895 [Rhipicephalus microplus]|uniref:uncharacterized protein LOC142813895 n=1 Tax=Rhipicephalus microplus TaxID=6941 RepID=UPI003F6B6F73
MFIIKCIIVAVHYIIQSSSGNFRSPTNSANVDSQQYKPASKSPLLVTMFLFKCIISAVIGYFGTLLVPWMLDTVGFSRTGVRPKTVAAWCKGRYKGFLPKNGLFATLQKWGMAGLPKIVQFGCFCLAGHFAWRII